MQTASTLTTETRLFFLRLTGLFFLLVFLAGCGGGGGGHSSSATGQVKPESSGNQAAGISQPCPGCPEDYTKPHAPKL